MVVSDPSDLVLLERRVVELERREAEIERELASLLVRSRRSPGREIEQQIADRRKEHLEVRRELNTLRARLVPIVQP